MDIPMYGGPDLIKLRQRHESQCLHGHRATANTHKGLPQVMQSSQPNKCLIQAIDDILAISIASAILIDAKEFDGAL